MKWQNARQPVQKVAHGHAKAVSQVCADHDPEKEDKANRQCGFVQGLCQPRIHADAPKNFCIMGYIS